MQFKYPELLFALFLLIIPILIHLFQLRRFQKVEFTNVKFLKSVKLQTRKSSQLKKWIILLTRLLILACAIVAFAQPYIPNSDEFNEEQETVLYIDNSFSMQAKGTNGTLLNKIIQDILNTVPDDEPITIFTNNSTFRNTTLKAIKNDIINLDYSPFQLNYNAAYLKGSQLFSSKNTATKKLILVSDFQQKDYPLAFERDSTIQLRLVQTVPQKTGNISIDSVYVSNSEAETLNLKVALSSEAIEVENISVSLFNDDVLLAKSALDIGANTELDFTIPNNKIINAKLTLEDDNLQYDNTFYFNINNKPKIKVLVINEAASDAYLNRIYTEDEFNYKSFKLDALNYNLIPEQNLVILNELKDIPNALQEALKSFSRGDGSVLFIPSTKIELNSYNQCFTELKISKYTTIIDDSKLVTSINYNHPVFVNSFNSKVTNFQYPKVEQSFQFASRNNSALSFEDGSSFLTGYNNIYAFSAALNERNSNFKNSQLIVPTLYNIGLKSSKLSRLYYTVGEQNKIDIATSLEQDDILTLHLKDNVIIPLQKTYSQKIVIEYSDLPDKAGIYTVMNKNESLENVSFNYNRNESNLLYYDLKQIENIDVDDNLETTINTLKRSTNVNALWKWFVIFALVFLIIEMLILKFLK